MTFTQEHLVGIIDFRRFFEAGGVKFHGNRAACCPFHHDRRPSFSINLATGLWKCHAKKCGLAGDPVTFLARKLGISTAASIAELRRRYRIGGSS